LKARYLNGLEGSEQPSTAERPTTSSPVPTARDRKKGDRAIFKGKWTAAEKDSLSERDAGPDVSTGWSYYTPRQIFSGAEHDPRRYYFVFISLAAITGIVCGIAAIGFRYLIIFFRDIFFSHQGVLSRPALILIVVIPAIGGLITGLIVFHVARESKGSGIPEVMEANLTRGGRMRPRIVFEKALASAITIGSGGSAGREGPIVMMGAGTGSTIAQKIGLNPHQTRVLLACGAAGGISATFNTPIAAVIFSIELILTEFRTRSFIPVAVSSVFATVVSQGLLYSITGQHEMFAIHILEDYTLITPWELALYLILGLLAGLVAILFIKTLYSVDGFFDRLKLPDYVKPALGGLLVGAMGLAIFLTVQHTDYSDGTISDTHVLGVGYESIDYILMGNFQQFTIVALALLASLVIFKILATGLTIGSGGSGGVFAPSLFIGAMLGASFGILANQYAPFATESYQAYALVGMAALFAGASRATITSIIMVFEMTGNYALILPLMFACVIADATAASSFDGTLFSIKLKQRGITILHERQVDAMETLSIRDVMSTRVVTVTDDTELEELKELMDVTGYHGFPVVDEKGRLDGMVTHKDLRASRRGKKKYRSVKDIKTHEVVTVYPDITLAEALRKLGALNVGHIPVVSPNDPTMVEGLVTRKDIMTAYQERRMELNL